jgi:DNA-binding beta-propeller fold protein YncE
MTAQGGRRRRLGVLLIAAGLLALASAPAALGSDRIYWGNGGTDTISYANLDGSGGGGQLNLSGATPSGPRGVAIDAAAGRIYWANQENNTISYANLDGSGGGGELNISGTTTSKPHGLAIYPEAGIIYWANENDTISYAFLDGSGGGQLDISGATAASPYGAAIDPAGGRIYWANTSGSVISYANLDNTGRGGQLDITGTTADDAHGLTIDSLGGRIYWANFYPAESRTTISYANLDGSGEGNELDLSGASPAGTVGLAIDHDAGRLYMGNLGSWEISYADLDGLGGGGELNISGATPNQPRFMALLRAPSGTGVPQIGGGSSPASVLTCSPGTWAPDQLGSYLYRAPQSLAYQWTRNGADIGGATETTYATHLSGDYRCRVKATNAAGSTSQTSDPHAVSANPPDTKLTRVRMNSPHHKARFVFKGTGEVSGFKCTLERPQGRPTVKRCHSPRTYRHLQPGQYLFEVHAFGPGGPDLTPTEKQLTIP